MSRFLRTRDGSSIDMLGVAAMVLIAAAVGFAILEVVPAWSLYRNPPKVSDAKRVPADSIEKFNDSTDHQMRLVDGRSWFFEPRPPDSIPEKTTIALKYNGPSLLAFINGTAYFSDGQKISIAEPKSKTLKLVRANPPWTITVQWEGGEFAVDLFKRTDILSLKDGSGFSSSFPAPIPRPIPVPLSGVAPSDRSDLPPDAHRGPGADPLPPSAPAAAETSTRPVPASDPASPPPASPAPTPTPPPAPGTAPPPSTTTPSTSMPAPVDPRSEPAPPTQTSPTSKP